MANGGKYTNLIDSVVDFPIGEVDQFDFFESVDRLVYQSLDLVDTGIGSLTQLGYYLEVLH